MSDDVLAKFRTLKNAIEMLGQVEEFDMDYDLSVLEDVVRDGQRVVNTGTALIEALHAAGARSVESLISE